MDLVEGFPEIPESTSFIPNSEKEVVDNIILRLRIKKKQREISEIDLAIKENDELNQKILEEEENKMIDYEACKDDENSEFYVKLDQNITEMNSELQARNSSFYWLKSIFSDFTMIQLVVLFLIGLIASKFLVFNEKKYF